MRRKTFLTILTALDELGYDAEWQNINSKNFGVPQNRERLFIVGHLRGTSGRKVFPVRGDSGTTNSNNIKRINDSKKTIELLKYDNINRFYNTDGIAPTLNSMQGGGREPKIAIKEATKKGYTLATVGDSVNYTYPNSETRRGRVGKQIAQTLQAGAVTQGTVTNDLRIRKLTPKECFRLQGFTDEQFHKAEEVNSNSQLYKQAGNSVTVNVIQAIAERL